LNQHSELGLNQHMGTWLNLTCAVSYKSIEIG